MKLRFTFKTPDAVSEGLKEAGIDLEDDPMAMVTITNFVRGGEYVIIEIDTNAGTARVVPRTDKAGASFI